MTKCRMIVSAVLFCMVARGADTQLTPEWVIKRGNWAVEKDTISGSSGILMHTNADVRTFEMKGEISVRNWTGEGNRQIVGIFWGWTGKMAHESAVEWANRMHLYVRPDRVHIDQMNGAQASRCVWQQLQTFEAGKSYPFHIKITRGGGIVRIGRLTAKLDRWCVKTGHIALFASGADVDFRKFRIEKAKP